MKIQVLGTGCAPCKATLKNAHMAAEELGLDCQVEHVTRLQTMIEFGVTGTPALVVDGQVKSMGRLLDVPAIKAFLQERRDPVEV